jgi:hypothetical protein
MFCIQPNNGFIFLKTANQTLYLCFYQRVKKGPTNAYFDPSQLFIKVTKHTLDESTFVFLKEVTRCAGCGEEGKLCTFFGPKYYIGYT